MLQGKTAHRDSTHDEKRARLRDIIRSESLLTGSQFTLASGQKSGFFFDLKKTMFHPEGAALVAELIFEMIKDDRDVEYLGGLEIGAIPIVACVCAKSWPSRPVRAFFVRKEPKDHGTSKLIDGQFRPNSNVIIVEDVTTTGGSAMKAVDAVRDQGCSVKKVLTIVDRCEGATENLRKEGLELVSIFTIADFSD